MQQVIALHKKVYGGKSAAPYVYSHAPGRMNFIGEHVDYMGGCVVPAAINYASDVIMTSEQSDVWRFSFSSPAIKGGEVVTVTFEDKPTIEKGKSFRTICFGAAYQGWKLCGGASRKDLAPQHIRIVLLSDVPLGAGLSSSAAICVSLINGLSLYFMPHKARFLQGIDLSPSEKVAFDAFRKQLAKAGRAVEVEHCGVNIGIMDQYASIFGMKDTVLKVDCGALEHEYVKMPDPSVANYGIILVNSMRAHNLGADYNKIRKDMENTEDKVTKYLESKGAGTGKKVCLKDMVGKRFEGKTSTDFLRSLLQKGILTQGEFDRASYAVSEMERTDEFVGLTKKPELISHPIKMLNRMGALLNETHNGMAKKLKVSTGEVDKIHEVLSCSPGVYGARIMGGGFGGCVVAIIDKTKFSQAVRRNLQNEFKKKFPDVGACDVYDVKISRGAFTQKIKSSHL